MDHERWSIGVDVGGTKTAIALVGCPSGTIALRDQLPTPAGTASGADFLDLVVARVTSLLGESVASGRPASAIGIAVCELVDPDGVIASAHRLHWRGLDVAARFGTLAPCRVEADVRAAALAEARWGAGQGLRDFLYINVGTGVSSCWVRDGHPHAGARGNALLLASSPVSVPGFAGAEPLSYCPEDLAGGAGLVARYNAASAGSVTSAAAVLEAADRGDASAQRLLGEGTLALGVNLGLAINILDPGAVVVGGGLGSAPGYLRALIRTTRPHIWAETTRGLPILASGLGADSGVIGAAALAY